MAFKLLKISFSYLITIMAVIAAAVSLTTIHKLLLILAYIYLVAKDVIICCNKLSSRKDELLIVTIFSVVYAR